jgi:hypothetical protein
MLADCVRRGARDRCTNERSLLGETPAPESANAYNDRPAFARESRKCAGNRRVSRVAAVLTISV